MWHKQTWGAHTSISHPDSFFTLAQWDYKKQFVLDLDSLSRKLVNNWIHPNQASPKGGYRIYNTSEWPSSG